MLSDIPRNGMRRTPWNYKIYSTGSKLTNFKIYCYLVRIFSCYDEVQDLYRRVHRLWSTRIRAEADIISNCDIWNNDMKLIGSFLASGCVDWVNSAVQYRYRGGHDYTEYR